MSSISSSNLLNGGLVCRSGGRFYYSDFTNGGALASCDEGFRSKTVLDPAPSRYIQPYGGGILYAHKMSPGVMLLDRDGGRELSDMTVRCLCSRDDGIYFVRDGDRTVFRLSDGVAECIDPRCAWYLSLDDRAMVFRDNGDMSLVSIVDGVEHRLDVYAADPLICGDSVYFSNGDDGNSICRTDLSLGGIEKVCGDKAFSLNCCGGKMYYSNWSDGRRLYAVDVDDRERRMILDEPVWCLNLIDDLLFYRIFDDEDSPLRFVDVGTGEMGVMP